MIGLPSQLRQIARSPAFVLTFVVTLAVGIGASALLYSVVDGVLLAPLPYPDAGRIVAVSQLNESGAQARPSDPNFADLQAQTHSLASFAQYAAYQAPVAGGDEPVLTMVADVSREFFDVLGVRPALGRSFAPEEQVPGAAPVAIVSYRYWQRYLGGTPDFAQRTLRYDHRVLSVVGVMPRGFDYPDETDVWASREQAWPQGGRRAHNFYAIGRLAPAVSLDAARSDFSAVARRLKQQYGEDTWMVDAAVVPLRDDLVGRARLPLLMLAAAAALLYVISVANVVNLLLARAIARRQELATRLALGARRTRLARDSFVEAALLAGLGGALGVVVAGWGARALLVLGPTLLPRAASIHVDATTAAVALLLALIAASSASVLVAWRTPADAEELRGERHATVGRSRAQLRDGLVAAQIAVALVLVIGASLLGRSYVAVANVDPGFQPEGMLLVGVTSPYSREQGAQILGLQERVLETLRALPGVASAGAVSGLPLRGAGTNGQFVVLDRPDQVHDFADLNTLSKQPGRAGYAEYRVASEQYFRTLGIPLLSGRTFASTDTPEAAHVALVSRSLADAQWPGETPLGKLIEFGGMDGDLTPFTVIGVVGDVRDYGLDRSVRPTVYAYYRQRPAFADSLWFALRMPAAASAIPAAREAIRRIDPNVPPQFLTSEQLFSGSIAQRRFNLVMLGVFGGAALVLALAGVYAAIAFGVAQRRHEIGIRIALGATLGRIVALVLGRSLWIAGLGVAAGLAMAFGAARVVSSLLYGVAPHDPLSYSIASALLLAAAACAALVPALRAARADPVETLHHD